MISMTLYKVSGIFSSHVTEPKGARTLTGSAILSPIEPSRNGSFRPQSPNKSPGAAPHDRFCGPRWLRRSQLQVVDHLLAFVVAHGESRRHGVQPGRVAPLLRAHGARRRCGEPALGMTARPGNPLFGLIRPVHAPMPAASGGRRGSSPAPRLRRPVE